SILVRVVSLRSAVCMLGRFPALAGADLDVDAGEILLIAGPNGAGKTTLLRLCAGLLPLRAGTAEVLGIDLSRDRETVRPSLGLARSIATREVRIVAGQIEPTVVREEPVVIPFEARA